MLTSKSELKTKKFDGFHIVLILSIAMGILSIVFILLTARPQELKLIKWSVVDSYDEVIQALGKRQYPVLSSTKVLNIWGLENIKLSSLEVAQTIQKFTNIEAVPTTMEVGALPANTAATSSKSASHILLNPNEDSNLDIFIEVYKFMNEEDVNPDEFYDPLFLKKEMKKYDGPLFFTAYQKNSGQILVDIIRIRNANIENRKN